MGNQDCLFDKLCLRCLLNMQDKMSSNQMTLQTEVQRIDLNQTQESVTHMGLEICIWELLGLCDIFFFFFFAWDEIPQRGYIEMWALCHHNNQNLGRKGGTSHSDRQEVTSELEIHEAML